MSMTHEVCAALIKTAIANAKTFPSREEGVNYFEATILQRLPGPKAQGSVFSSRWADPTLKSIATTLLLLDWEPYAAPNLFPGAIALRAEAPGCGHLGVVRLAGRNVTETVIVDDVKATGEYSVCIKGNLGPLQNHVVAILTNEGTDAVPKWTLATVHPGDPIPPSVVKAADGKVKEGQVMTVAEAIMAGFQYAKVKA